MNSTSTAMCLPRTLTSTDVATEATLNLKFNRTWSLFPSWTLVKVAV
jgi:hypothetical protein